MTYEIKKMQPIAGRPSGRAGALYPFAELRIGEGFHAPVAKRTSLGAAASRLGTKLGRRFRVQKVDAERVQVCRVEDPK